MSKLLEMYLNEATTYGDVSTPFPPTQSDYPAGSLIHGEKMVPELIPTVQGMMKRHKSDPNFTWTEFESCHGMDDKKNYHTSLLGIEKLIKRDDWSLDKYIGRSKDDAATMRKLNKINAKEPLGKEPIAYIDPKTDKGGRVTKTKVKQVKDKTGNVQVGDVKGYADIKATSVDKEISKHVAGAQIKESIEDRIGEYVNEADLTGQEEKDILLSITSGKGLKLHLKQINVDLVAKKVPEGIQFEYKEHMDLTMELVQLCDKHKFKFKMKDVGKNTVFTVLK